MLSQMNYLWTPTFPLEDQKESITLTPLQQKSVEKRDLEVETLPIKTGNKKQRRSKKNETTSPEQDFSQMENTKDKGRGRYACLNHRMKHKRCPPDCKERRPRPMQNPLDGSPNDTSDQTPQMDTPLQNNVLQLDNVLSSLPPPVQTTLATNPVAAPIGINPLMTVSALPSLETEWDSAEWEGLMEDQSRNQWGPEIESWDDIPNAINWESEGSDSSIDSFGGSASLFDEPQPHTTELREMVLPIILTRDVVERWLPEPHFDQLVQGFYVRVRIGEYMDTSVYRIARIDEVIGRAFFGYNLGQQETNKGIAITIGSNKKTFSLLSVSNKPPTDADLQHWEEECQKHHKSEAINSDYIREREKILRVMNLKYPPKMTSPGSGFGSTSI